MAEKALMIEINVRDHPDFRLHYIRRVEPSAKSHFEYRKLHAGSRKMLKRQRRYHFKKRRMRPQFPLGQQLFDQRLYFRKRFRKVRVGNLFAIYADPLVDSFQMRRRVKTGFDSRGTEN